MVLAKSTNDWSSWFIFDAWKPYPKGTFIDAKKACEKIIVGINELSPENYRFGHTKLFFKAGMIGMLEDLRDDKINNILTMLQTKMRCNMSRPKFLAIRRERDAAVIIQNNWRKYQVLKDRSLKDAKI